MSLSGNNSIERATGVQDCGPEQEYFGDERDCDESEDLYCDACDEFGMYVICVDDLCHSGSGCIHGDDDEVICPYCGGRGKL